jgi:Na+-transporting methylmalonyl-CoA/oxaloacetate decarboxylase gamma subunit
MHLPNFPVAAAIPDVPGLMQSIGYQVSGWLVVLLAIVALWLMIEGAHAVIRRHTAAALAPEPVVVAQPAVAPATPVQAAPVEDRPAAEIVAVIAAAVDQALQGRGRIVSITPLGGASGAGTAQAWSGEGRRSLFASHKVR